MDSQNMVKENIDILFEKLEKFLKTETVVGQPIVIGDTTLLPIISISFGAATGAGSGSSNGDAKVGSGSGSGSGLGSAAKVSPAAIVVIRKDEVSLLPIKDKVGLSNLIEKVPDLMDKIDTMRQKQKDQPTKEHTEKQPDSKAETDNNSNT
ncbi:MAG: sporulation protein [Ruminococcaceae bacterium]|nr:sporulation protein [Oscillospiraceae bacterium]